MHPSQMSGFRKTIIALLTITFAGALLVFTAQANLALLMSVYPNPQFYMFGLLALEGGVVYWTGYYLLHLHGIHKGLAVFALAVDAILSGTGFFYEMESVTHSVGTVSLPPVVVIVAFAVVFNVAMSIISHLIPSSSGRYTALPPRPAHRVVEARQTATLPDPANQLENGAENQVDPTNQLEKPPMGFIGNVAQYTHNGITKRWGGSRPGAGRKST